MKRSCSSVAWPAGIVSFIRPFNSSANEDADAASPPAMSVRREIIPRDVIASNLRRRAFQRPLRVPGRLQLQRLAHARRSRVLCGARLSVRAASAAVRRRAEDRQDRIKDGLELWIF